jgi:DNA-binding MarR family transcriptional regulator
MAVKRKVGGGDNVVARRKQTPGQTPEHRAHTKKKAMDVHTHAHSSSDLNNLIHERTRLGLVSALASHKTMSFTELKTLLNISDGNLSAHARKLEEAGYIECSKGYDGRVPRTEYTLSTNGRKALHSYVSHMEALIAAMKK